MPFWPELASSGQVEDPNADSWRQRQTDIIYTQEGDYVSGVSWELDKTTDGKQTEHKAHMTRDYQNKTANRNTDRLRNISLTQTTGKQRKR